MKRTLLILLVGFSATFSAVAEDKPVAEQEVVMEFKQFCEDIAADEGTDDLSLPEYLLQCINDELEAEGFQLITSVPK